MTRSNPHPGPLAGVRVLELAQILAGPTAGQMLADLGADVIKVEKLATGDDTRSYSEPRVAGVSAPFLTLNRNKRGLAIDLKNPSGQQVIKQMVARADVLIENYRHDTLDKLGIGYDVLRAINPALIYCAISGFGRSGPYASKGGFDLVAQGFSGLMSITGEPGGAPVKTGNPVADINAGMLAVIGVLSAYAHRLKTGIGQRVETSLMEAALHQTTWHAAAWFATGVSPGPLGSSHLLTAPYQAFKTADGYINIGGANQRNWARLCEVLDAPQWKDDARFATNAARMTNLPELVRLIEDKLGAQPSAYWLEKLDALGVPAGPVHTIGQALSHPQVAAREMIVETEHRTVGRTRALGFPVKLSGSPARVDRPAPLLGEHSREVLAEFGFTEQQINALIEQGVVEQARF